MTTLKHTRRSSLPSPDPVQRTNLTTLILDQLRQYAITHGLKAGDRLPPERELAARLRVSRPSLRNALNWLSGRNAVRRVQGGGTFLEPGFLSVVAEGNGYRNGNPINMSEVVEARIELEPLLVRMAAARVTRKQLDELQAEVDRAAREVDDLAAWHQHNLHFHARLAQLAGNSILASTLESILSHVLTFWVRSSGPADRGRCYADHRSVLAALERGDGDAAAQRMRDHLKVFADAVAESRSTDR